MDKVFRIASNGAAGGGDWVDYDTGRPVANSDFGPASPRRDPVSVWAAYEDRAKAPGADILNRIHDLYMTPGTSRDAVRVALVEAQDSGIAFDSDGMVLINAIAERFQIPISHKIEMRESTGKAGGPDLRTVARVTVG